MILISDMKGVDIDGPPYVGATLNFLGTVGPRRQYRTQSLMWLPSFRIQLGIFTYKKRTGAEAPVLRLPRLLVASGAARAVAHRAGGGDIGPGRVRDVVVAADEGVERS